MIIDCAIIGGGPAGLNAALVLGRARRNVVLFDDNRPRNAVTHATHGFITRDGVKPAEFRRLAHQDISKYPSVEMRSTLITDVSSNDGLFSLVADNGSVAQAKTVILAPGFKETLPDIANIHDYYGRSLFSCPYCDGWELRDKPLLIIAEDGERAFHMAKVVLNWSRDLLVCTNGQTSLTGEQKATLQKKDIRIIEDRISALVGTEGMLERVVFSGGEEITRQGGFVATQWTHSPLGAMLGCELTAQGGIQTDDLGRTSVPGVYAAGDASIPMPSQLIIAAASGSRAAAGVNTDLTQRDFES